MQEKGYKNPSDYLTETESDEEETEQIQKLNRDSKMAKSLIGSNGKDVLANLNEEAETT